MKTLSDEKTSSGDYTVKVSGLYEVLLEGAKGASGGGGAAGYYSDQQSGSAGSNGSVVTAKYYLLKGTKLTFTKGSTGTTGATATGRSGASGKAGGSLNGGTGTGGGNGSEHSVCGNAGGGGGGGGGGGAAYVKIGSSLIMTANGGAGGSGGKGGGGRGGLACLGGNQHDGGSGGSGGAGGVYTGYSNYKNVDSGEGWTYYGTASSVTASGTSKLKVTLIKYAPCNNDCKLETNTANFIDVKTSKRACTGLPANAEWNSVSEITQTWDGSAWSPSSTAGTYNTAASTNECRFKCKTNYYWDNNQCINVKTNVSCGTLKANAEWNTVSSITQTYTTAGGWSPATTQSYNETPSATECRFKCKSTHTWNGSACVNTRTVSCPALPSGAVYNTASSITQNWTPAGGWQPSNELTYNTTPVTNACHYKCNTNYTWDGSQCEADSHSANCTGLPTNAKWNTVSSITQTWNGNAWTPSNTGTYNVNPSNSECRYKCKDGFHTENGGATCISNSKTSACTGLPSTGAVWTYTNTTSQSISQTWNTSASVWTPSNVGTYNTTADSTQCRFKCKEHYTWNSSTQKCEADKQTHYCTGLPANAQWNTVSSYQQTWDGNAWSPAATSATYSTEATSAACHFKCKANYNWKDGRCLRSHLAWGFESDLPGDWISQVSNSYWTRVSGSSSISGYNANLPGAQEGTYAMCSNNMNNHSTMGNLILKVTVPDDPLYKGTLSFRYVGTSEKNYDVFHVYLDPTQSDINYNAAACSNSATQILCTYGTDHASWETVQISNLAPGEHRILFKYRKDGSANTNADRYCIDNLTWDLTDAVSCPASLNSAPLYLKFNEGSGSTTANSGTSGGSYSVSGGSWVTSVGERGKAYNFAGSTTVSTSAPKYSDNFTMMAWVKVTSGYTITLPSQSSSGTNGTSGQHYLFGANHESSNAGAGLSVGTNGIFVTAHGDGYMPPLAVYSGSLGTSWHHVAVVFNSRIPYIYLDGVLVQTGSASSRTTYSPTAVGSGSYGSFYGAVDDVRIIGSALTSEQIKWEYYNNKNCSSL